MTPQGRRLRPCSGGCGKTFRSHLALPMCQPCRRERNPVSRRTEPCVTCGKPIDTSRKYLPEARCRDCSRARRATCPPCSRCGGKMGATWFYRWLKGKARLPPACLSCQKAAR